MTAPIVTHQARVPLSIPHMLESNANRARQTIVLQARFALPKVEGQLWTRLAEAAQDKS